MVSLVITSILLLSTMDRYTGELRRHATRSAGGLIIYSVGGGLTSNERHG